MNLLLGLLLSSLTGFAGYKKGALSKSGVLGAVLVGTAIFGFGGWTAGVVLIAFFISSSLLSFFKAEAKQAVAEKFDKGHRRDLGQTFANGGVAAITAALGVIWPGDWWQLAFLGAMAAVTADTWATEFGVLSKHPPRLITTGKPTAPGASGGISLVGSLAAFGGAIFIGATAWLLLGAQQLLGGTPPIPYAGHFLLVPLIGAAGFLGAMVDSFIGATWQAMYYCPVCDKETEQRLHHACGDTPTRFIRGAQWLNNDLVNFISSAAGALFAIAGALLLS